jgi:nitronate monooxygenase
VPAIAAPMFLVSGPELVTETCKAGVAGTFPALNARTPEQFDAWLGEIDGALARPGPPIRRRASPPTASI